jgi:predicted MFS family arabinose efflux permease
MVLMTQNRPSRAGPRIDFPAGHERRFPRNHVRRSSHPGAQLGGGFALLLFVVGSDLNIVAPLLPGIRTTFGVTLAATGQLITIFTAGYTLASPFIGNLTDRLGRRVVLYGGLLFFTVFEAVSAWAPSFPVLLMGRALTGIAAAAITPTVYTIIGDAVPYRERARIMSIASVGFSVSAIAGVPLALWLSGFWSWRGVLWALTAATLAAAGAVAFALGAAPAPKQAARPCPQRHGRSLAETRSILAATGSVLAVSFLAFAALGLVYTYLVIDLESVWHWSNERILGFLLLFGIANVTGNLGLGRLGDLWGNNRAVRVAQAIQFIALFGIAGSSLWHLAWALMLALLIFSLSRAYIPNLKAMASAIAPELRGRSQAWNNAAMYGGMMVGSWAASYRYQAIGLTGLSVAAAAVVALGWCLSRAPDRQELDPISSSKARH